MPNLRGGVGAVLVGGDDDVEAGVRGGAAAAHQVVVGDGGDGARGGGGDVVEGGELAGDKADAAPAVDAVIEVVAADDVAAPFNGVGAHGVARDGVASDLRFALVVDGARIGGERAVKFAPVNHAGGGVEPRSIGLTVKRVAHLGVREIIHDDVARGGILRDHHSPTHLFVLAHAVGLEVGIGWTERDAQQVAVPRTFTLTAALDELHQRRAHERPVSGQRARDVARATHIITEHQAAHAHRLFGDMERATRHVDDHAHIAADAVYKVANQESTIVLALRD